MKTFKQFIINSFVDSTHYLSGNPAAVVFLNEELGTNIMQKIAKQNNLPETVFIIKKESKYYLRWFTPNKEVQNATHASLAAIYLLQDEVNIFCYKNKNPLQYAKIDNKIYEKKLLKNIHNTHINIEMDKVIDSFLTENNDIVYVLDKLEDVNTYICDCINIQKLPYRSVVITAVGNETLNSDIVCRVFAPKYAVNEDVATGSIHFNLLVYWSKILNQNSLLSKQLSDKLGLIYTFIDNGVCFVGGEMNIFSIGEFFNETGEKNEDNKGNNVTKFKK